MKYIQSYLKNNLKQFGWNSVFAVYLKQFTALIVVPVLLLELFLCFVLMNNYNENIATNISADSIKFQNQINVELDNVEKLVTQLAADENFNFFRYKEKISFSDTKDSDVACALSKNISLFKELSHSVNAIDIYFEQSKYVFSTNNAGYLDNFERKNIVENLHDAGYNQTHYGIVSNKSYNSVTTYFAEYIRGKLNYIVFLTIDMTDIAQKHMQLKKQVFTLATQTEQIVYCSDGEFLKNINDVRINDVRDIDALDLSFEYATYDATLDFMGVKYKIYTQLEEYNAIKRRMIVVSILCFLGSFFLVVLLSAYMSGKYYKKLIEILTRFDGIDVASEKYHNEFEIIESNISFILAENSDTESNLSSQMAKMKKLQFVIMQNQINPHIILNTINAAKLYLYNLFDDEATPIRLMDGLSHMLTNLLDTESVYTKVADEIEYAKEYLRLENIKQCGSFEVVWDVEESTLDCMMIKMILQPIIENALFYGIYPLRDRKGVLNIKIYKEDSCIVFVVKDNGYGMSPAKLKEINENLMNDSMPSGSHIGLKNIALRLKTFYENNDFPMHITSDKDGTTVKIRFPM